MIDPQTARAETSDPGMAVMEAIEVLAAARAPNQVVITNQGSARLWPVIAQHPLDFHYNPSTMGGAVPLGLGIALAQSQREVMVVAGEGSLLMSLGSLVTVVAAGCKNLTVVILDNGIYEVTGGQKTPASDRAVDFAGVARSAGFSTVARVSVASDWRDRAGSLLSAPGPRFIWLVVAHAPPTDLQAEPAAISEQVRRLKKELAV